MTPRPFFQSQLSVNILAGIALLGLLLASYANSFHGAWQYDDFGNIVNNDGVHMTQWSWDQLKRVFSAGLSHQIISRPLAYLSFAANYRIGGLDVFGFHLFNFTVHWLASVFLFLFIRNWLNLAIFDGRYRQQANGIACISSLLWATHPIHVTAVTFVVQRMASMTGLFYIAAMYFYIKARTFGGLRKSWLFFFLAAFCGLCALLTKENAVLLFYALLLLEFLFIQGADSRRRARCFAWFVGVTVAIGLLGSLYTHPFHLFHSSDIRPYTWLERLMTQPRVIWLYLAYIVFPMTSKLTLLHDIEISHSLFSPWTTALSAAALAACLAALVILALRHRRNPLAYCGLFFLLNHLVEGSIFNLELVYEHRNYIPTMLIFVPAGLAAVRGWDQFSYRRSFQWMIGGAVALVLVSQCYTTAAYNRVFATERSLWTHVTLRAPGLSLGYNNLGNIYWNSGQWDRAFNAFKKAYELNRYFNYRHKGLVHHNLGLYYICREGDFQRALFHFKAAFALYPENSRIRYQLARAQIATEHFEAANQTLSEAVVKWPDNADFYYLMGLLRIKKGQCTGAFEYAQKALDLDSSNRGALSVMAEACRCKGELSSALGYWDEVVQLEPTDVNALLACMVLSVRNKQPILAMSYLDQLTAESGGKSLDAMLRIVKRYSALNAFAVDPLEIRQVIQGLVSR